MLVDFAMLPPEINSARMYAGPGVGSLQAAAVTWGELSADLQSTAQIYESVVSDLRAYRWLGPSSMSMAAAVIPYVEWLTTTAAQARQTAGQAAAAVAAFEQAFAMTVPPPVVAANRGELAVLTATNFFGQNAAAIAAVELHYAEMWAQDATAMFDYEGASAAAATLAPFASPEQTTSSKGVTAQNAAVAQASAPAGSDGVFGGALRFILQAIEGGILPLAPELLPLFEAGEAALDVWQQFPDLVSDDFTVLDGVLAWYASVNTVDTVESIGTGFIRAQQALGLLPNLGPPAAPPVAAPELLGSLKSIADAISGGGSRALAGLGSKVSAAMTSAGRVGPMSVPAAWAAPEVASVSQLQGTPLTTVALDNGPAAVMPGVPLVGSGRTAAVPRYGSQLTVMTRPFSGG
ncbi:PPE family protein [Mycobacterium spongiae]|uniref:PPE domain-containing protein n=1 Tax=Mycobacterium spongiae TaxID=886343 RepID=A0A975JVQ3_9MYCO|nr:PPE family protein [Mycobacterium spongiae]QUR66258.1 PPE domain-containing protein [Mycobacterium spongiae]